MTHRQRTASFAAILLLVVGVLTRMGTLTTSSSHTKKSSLPPPADGAIEHVARVIDGDTFVLTDGWKVRYIGINAPEIAHPPDPKPAQCYGDEATQADEQLINGKDVRLVKDISETDKFGRLLRYVYVGDQFINEELVREGVAQAKAFPPDVRFKQEFEDTQAAAKQNNAGLWGVCK